MLPLAFNYKAVGKFAGVIDEKVDFQIGIVNCLTNQLLSGENRLARNYMFLDFVLGNLAIAVAQKKPLDHFSRLRPD